MKRRAIETMHASICTRHSMHAIVATLLIVLANGCGNNGVQPVERASVSGNVTLDDQPLKSGAIVFLGPVEDGIEPNVTAVGYVQAGCYSIHAEAGPEVGTAQVEFRAEPLDRSKLEAALDEAATKRSRRPVETTVVEIPIKYQKNSDLRVEIVSGVENRHDFQLYTH